MKSTVGFDIRMTWRGLVLGCKPSGALAAPPPQPAVAAIACTCPRPPAPGSLVRAVPRSSVSKGIPMQRSLLSPAWRLARAVPRGARRAPGAARCEAGTLGVPVRFTLAREVAFGESHVLTGSHPSLGIWKVRKSPSMAWGEGNVWSAEVVVPAGTRLEFKVGASWGGEGGGGAGLRCAMLHAAVAVRLAAGLRASHADAGHWPLPPPRRSCKPAGPARCGRREATTRCRSPRRGRTRWTSPSAGPTESRRWPPRPAASRRWCRRRRRRRSRPGRRMIAMPPRPSG